MSYLKFVARSIVALSLSANAIAQQQEDTSNPTANYSLKSQTRVPTGPPETYVYVSTGTSSSTDPFVNTFGKFVIGPDASPGKATYWWRGKGPSSNPTAQHSDTLNFLGRVTVADTRPDTNGAVDGWLYEATDGAGNTFWLVFGESPLKNLPFYPVYYTFSDPVNNKFQRWLTKSGTRRL